MLFLFLSLPSDQNGDSPLSARSDGLSNLPSPFTGDIYQNSSWLFAMKLFFCLFFPVLSQTKCQSCVINAALYNASAPSVRLHSSTIPVYTLYNYTAQPALFDLKFKITQTWPAPLHVRCATRCIIQHAENENAADFPEVLVH